jgi:hypothetical protein
MDNVEALEEMMDAWEDLMVLCERAAEVCSGHTNKTDPHYRFGYHIPQCLKPPTRVVRWSDRVAYCCDEHVDCIKGYAARDSQSDRTDEPYVDTFNNDEIVMKYWDKLVERAEVV